MKLSLFYTKNSQKEIQIIKNALTTTYEDILEVVVDGELAPIEDAYNSERDQYDADLLLTHLIKKKKIEAALWVIKKDLYCHGMNFIFGYALHYKGAVLSTYRLSSQGLIEKEAIHEVGHILGLNHCRNRCVMQFSKSLWEAKMKPSSLCRQCKTKLNIP